MAVFRIEKTRDYTVMSNHHLKNKNLTLKAKGLMSLLLSLPDDWVHTLAGLAQISVEGVDAIRMAVHELEREGYVVRNRIRNEKGHLGEMEYTQFKRVWQYIVTRTTKERTYVRYINGQRITKTVTPVFGEKAGHNGHVVYSLDFQVTPHQLRHTYITNLIYASVDPKTVQYLAGHENSKVTMDIYAKVKYNRPEQLLGIVNSAFGQAT